MQEEKKVPHVYYWIVAICFPIMVFIFAYGSIIAGWMRIPKMVENVEKIVSSDIPVIKETTSKTYKTLIATSSRRVATVTQDRETVLASIHPYNFRKVVVTIPPGGYPTHEVFTLDQEPLLLPHPLPEKFEFLGAFAIGRKIPEPIKLNRPATIIVELAQSDLVAVNGDFNRLSILYWDQKEWKPIQNLKPNPPTGSISFTSKELFFAALVKSKT